MASKKPTRVVIALDLRSAAYQELEPQPLEIDASYQLKGDPICVHRKHGCKKAWSATHVPTGLTAGDGFTTKRDAQAFIREALVLPFPWAWGTFGTREGRPVGLQEALLELRAKWPAIGV